MHPIVGEEEPANELLSKTSFVLYRELSLWDLKNADAELLLIIKELKCRRKKLATIELFLVSLLTMSLQLYVESLFNNRWLYFEDTKKEIIRQYAVSFLFLSVYPAYYVICQLVNHTSVSLLLPGIIYGLALAGGLFKAIWDVYYFKKAEHL